MPMNYVFVFIGDGALLPSGMYEKYDDAMDWVKKNKLSGSLHRLPVNVGLYDWALEKGFFEAKQDHQKTARFIERFQCASVDHWHIEDGEIE